MSWLLQTPGSTGPKLIDSIAAECGSASKGAAAFAFASANGVKLLLAEPKFQHFLSSSEFVAVVGLDAITDTKAVEELRKTEAKFPHFIPKLFLHEKTGSIFHPKTIWLRTPEGGVIITGSGNLTLGGLKANWEATQVEKLNATEMDAAEATWNAWLEAHKNELLDLDDPRTIERAKANAAQRAKVTKVLKAAKPGGESAEPEIEAVEEIIEDVAPELSLNPILIAEVPKAGDRWEQVNFDVGTYQQFFGVKLGSTKFVTFHHVQDDGTLGPPENRQSVAVKSKNYRFEVGAAKGLPYPSQGHPIVIFEKVTESIFRYVLLMPGQPGHALGPVYKLIDA